MNVTLRIPDELGRKAKHLAVDEGKSLSAVVVDLLEKRLESRKDTSREDRLRAWELFERGVTGGGERFDRRASYDRNATS